MLEHWMLAIAIALSILCFAAMYRAAKGPSAADRVVAINVISSKVTVLIILIAIILRQKNYIEVALVYALVGFITTVSVSKYLEKGKLF